MNTPKIRFKGFTDDWEQRKLDTVAKFSKGSGYSKGDLIETGTPIILYGRLYTKYETSISDVDTYVEAKEGSVYSKGGEVIVPASGETAEDIARAATVDKSGILLGGDLNVVMPNEDINSAFLAISISNGNSQRELAKKAQGKSVVHIHNEEIRNLIVPFPIKAEQNRIVDYFSTLDHLITLHQRKCDETKQLKKFMLQKMFPKNGEKNPEIRFKGFTDDWEQRKVGDQMYIKSRIGWQALTKQEYLSEGDYYLITGTDIDETTHRVDLKRSYYVSKERYEMDSKIQVKEGDIIVTKDGTIGKVAMVTGLDKPATLNSHLFVLRDMSGKLDNHFLLHILNSHMFNHFVKSTKTGSTLTGLPQKTFVEFAFSCPKYEEQKLLSNYFDRLDHLITLHQRKCEKLKELKKFMLQNMFV